MSWGDAFNKLKELPIPDPIDSLIDEGKKYLIKKTKEYLIKKAGEAYEAIKNKFENAILGNTSKKCCTKDVASITMKRKHIDIGADDKYGHWWFEIGDPTHANSESYGWWPKEGVGLKETIGGTNGELNGQTFGGTLTRDPHHGDTADESFHPTIECNDTRSDKEIEDCLRKFANCYSGEWRWTFGAGQNCHTFQEAAMKNCNLKGP
ncbi:MAG: hypothetical protein DRI57_06245 [Deltaproteobacteria bacterium]|nr:MAG: hypothetical protein DRI57_06245 [Deltaproteobacteria bacterium]